MKRLLIISGLTLCFLAMPASAQRRCGMHYGGMHGPGIGMGGPGFGMGGMHGSWGQTARGSGAWIDGSGRALNGSRNGSRAMSGANVQGTPAAKTAGVSPWRRMAGALGFAKSRPNPASTKGTTDVPETLRQPAPHNAHSTR